MDTGNADRSKPDHTRSEVRGPGSESRLGLAQATGPSSFSLGGSADREAGDTDDCPSDQVSRTPYEPGIALSVDRHSILTSALCTKKYWVCSPPILYMRPREVGDKVMLGGTGHGVWEFGFETRDRPQGAHCCSPRPWEDLRRDSVESGYFSSSPKGGFRMARAHFSIGYK